MCDKRTSTKYLENLKNMALVKLKVQESIDIFPKDHDELLKPYANLGLGNQNKNSSNNFEDISEFIKNEKRNNKKAKMKINLLDDEFNNDYDFTGKSKYGKNKNNSSNSNIDPSTGINKKFLKKYYKLYIEELETHVDELLQRNEELEEKINSFKSMENEIISKNLECIKFNKFKKISQCFKSEQKEVLETLNKDKKYNICDNPICTSNAVNLVDISKEYDKLLLENINLRRRVHESKREKQREKQRENLHDCMIKENK